MKTAYVYKWVHKPTYRWYIGSRTAHNAHPDDGYLCSSRIVKPMIKSNPEDWTREILFVGDPFEAYDFETELLDMFDARNDPRSFNQHNNEGKQSGKGHPSPNKGKSPSEETRQKLSIAGKNRILSEEHKQRISKALTGKIRSEEHAEKISKAKKGKSNGPHSEETKRKIAESQIGKIMPPVSEETRRKISASHTGTKRSEETKAKMSASAKAYKRTPEHEEALRLGRLKTATCTHCGHISNTSSITRWHNDNCKHKETIWQQ